MPVEGMDRREYRTRKFGSWERSQVLDTEVTTAGKAVGIAFEFGAITRTPNTLAGHKLLWLAGERACQDVVAEKLFSAYFVEGRDIGDVQVLQKIGVEAGLLSKDIEDALTSATVNAAVAEEEEHARDAGIRGVPTFTVTRQAPRFRRTARTFAGQPAGTGFCSKRCSDEYGGVLNLRRQRQARLRSGVMAYSRFSMAAALFASPMPVAALFASPRLVRAWLVHRFRPDLPAWGS